MLSLKEFKEKLDNQISSDELGKFYGGYDKTVNTTIEQNKFSDKYPDRLHYDFCHDGPDTFDDYRAGNYAVGCC